MPYIQTDPNEFDLPPRPKSPTRLTLHYGSPSRTFRWILLLAVFLTGQFFLNSSAYAEWAIFERAPAVSSNWELFNSRFGWAAGQDSENGTGVLLFLLNNSWISATLPDVSSDWALSGVGLTSSSKGWAVGQDFENKRGVLLYLRNPAMVSPPTITTTKPSNITDTTATGGGNITSDGGTSVTARGVCWSTSANPTLDDTCTSDGTGTGVFTSSITGLTANTQYHVRAYATNLAGTAFGNDLTFTTIATQLPTVTTSAVSNITDTTATGGGNVTSSGVTPVTQRGVCWSTLGNPDVDEDVCTNDGAGLGVFVSSITGLEPGTLYHVRAYAANSMGVAYGDDLTFTTTASALAMPRLSTTAISNLTATAASGGGLIWPIVSVVPPNVSSDWGLSAVHFFSSDGGWAVGRDSENGRGVILFFSDGSWTSVRLPYVSSDWGLSGVHFRWAVGQDLENGTGVILHFSGGSWTSILPPDVGSSNWGLSAVHYLSSKEAWAVGRDIENGTGVLLHFLDGSWTPEIPPDVGSLDWGLSSVDFISPDEGWAVGEDFQNGTGVLLHYLDGSWTSEPLPNPSPDWASWGLSGIHLISRTSGWAVGHASDGSNLKGILLRYSVPQISVSPTDIDFGEVQPGALLEKTVTVTNTGNGELVIGTITVPSLSPPFSITSDGCSGQSLARRRTCRVTYRFLPESEGSFPSSSDIPSNAFNQNPVTVTLNGTGKGETNYIHLLNPSNGNTFTACDYFNPPPFQWESSGIFSSIEVQFSLQNDFSSVALKAKGDPNVNQLLIKSNVWKKILLLPGAGGGTVYWTVVAKKKDKPMVKSDVFSFVVDAAQPVGNLDPPDMSYISKTASPPPTISWDNNCNNSFVVWFSNDPDFKTKKMPISFRIRDSGGVSDTFEKELTSKQWLFIRKLGGDITGATLYWYVESRDMLGRRQSSEVMSFVLDP